MRKNFLRIVSSLIVALVILSSCGSTKDVVYFQNIENEYNSELDKSSYEVRITPNDNLLISVSAANPLAAEAYNTIRMDRSMSAQTLELQGYLVDNNGNVNFPQIGTIHLAGLTKIEATNLLEREISKYIENPVVSIRFMNYKVSILGEVNRPGIYTFNNEKVTIPEILAVAGDMTIYGNRKEVLICREENGVKTFFRVDMTSPEVFMSPQYYLQQNDIIYIHPNKARAGSSTYNQNLPLIVSLTSVIITVVNLLTR